MSAYIGPPISTAPRVASSFAGRGAASAASIDAGELKGWPRGWSNLDSFRPE